jgi:hypothetical protein
MHGQLVIMTTWPQLIHIIHNSTYSTLFTLYMHAVPWLFLEKWCVHCGRPHSNAHKCLKCKKGVHAICGKVPIGGEEGYGSPIICNICDKEDGRGK